jgi:hypothetical protein
MKTKLAKALLPALLCVAGGIGATLFASPKALAGNDKFVGREGYYTGTCINEQCTNSSGCRSLSNILDWWYAGASCSGSFISSTGPGNCSEVYRLCRQEIEYDNKKPNCHGEEVDRTKTWRTMCAGEGPLLNAPPGGGE